MLNEKYVDPKTLRLTHFQKVVLRVLNDNDNPKVAAEQLSYGKDKANLSSAADILMKYGLINHDGRESSLTDAGRESIEEYNIANDPKLVTNQEPVGGQPAAGEADMEPTTGDDPLSDIPSPDGEKGEITDEKQEQMGADVGLESYSLLKDITKTLIEKKLIKKLS